MRRHAPRALAAALLLAFAPGARADDQTRPGAGNKEATALAAASPLVQSALRQVRIAITDLQDAKLLAETRDALFNPATCIRHRAGLDAEARQAILDRLLAEGLANPADAANITGGLAAGVFPPVVADDGPCPRLPQGFGVAPGSGFGSHHSFPGGLAVHESYNLVAGLDVADNYQTTYGRPGQDGLPRVGPRKAKAKGDLAIDGDLVLAAPLWHDWAKTLVFQWNANGTEFGELNFGGNGSTDANGAAGDSRTGGHHILSLAEAMARGLSPQFVITQASAHSAPSLGNEYKVVNWIRAAAIVARIDAFAGGYLAKDVAGNPRLPAFGPGGVDLNGAGQTNLLVEYAIHNLSDADFVFSIPAVTESQVILASLAPEYGHDPKDADYARAFRNPALAFLSGERILILYQAQGLDGVRAALDALRAKGVI